MVPMIGGKVEERQQRLTRGSDPADSVKRFSDGRGIPLYTTKFMATGASNVIRGLMSADDQGTISLNGTVVFAGAPDSTSPWASLESFIISTGFVACLNTLTVYVPNYVSNNLENGANDGPTGLQIAMTTVPEPETWAMMLLGFAGLAFAGYRKTGTLVAIA